MKYQSDNSNNKSSAQITHNGKNTNKVSEILKVCASNLLLKININD